MEINVDIQYMKVLLKTGEGAERTREINKSTEQEISRRVYLYYSITKKLKTVRCHSYFLIRQTQFP